MRSLTQIAVRPLRVNWCIIYLDFLHFRSEGSNAFPVKEGRKPMAHVLSDLFNLLLVYLIDFVLRLIQVFISLSPF